MVVVDYSIHDRMRRNEFDQNVDQIQQLLLDQDAAVDIAIENFCPRLRQAVTALSRHKVGPLQQRVHLSDFQSSALPSLPTDGLISNIQAPRNDRFVLALPYLYEENLPVSSHNFMVRWLIIAQCGRPDKAPEVILLEMLNSSIVSGYGEATLRRTQQRPQHQQRRQYQIIQERYWQQYVASDAFYIQCLTKWDKLNNNSSSLLQYCLLADQLYECYTNFQLYKLKISLKSTLSAIQPPPQLVQAYTQYKQLTRLSRLMGAVDNVTTDISVELFIDLESGINNYDDRRNQTALSATVRMRAIISIVQFEQTVAATPITSEATDVNDENKVLLQLASVTATFPPTGNKNATKASDNSVSLNKNFVVRILSSKLARTTPQGVMMEILLSTITDQGLDTTVIDFVTYVRRVQQAAVQAYNCDVSNSQENKPSSDDSDNNSAKLLLEALNEVFCDSPSNGNCLLDYQIDNNDTSTKTTTSFIRFLLIDGDVVTETTQLKYILTIEYKKVYKQLQSSTDKENTNQLTIKESVPVVSLRSVYDDENYDNYMDIDIDGIVGTDTDNVKYSYELANIIKIATINGMQKLRKDVLTPILTRYNKRWVPTDPYFLSSLSTPPPYPSIL